MTLGDYIDLVCTKVHRTDNPSREEARKYIASRYQMIYESYPWRDACEIAATSLIASQTVILPHIADRIIACRWATGITLRNESLWTILQIDPGRFDQIGDPMTYTIYSPSGVHTSPAGNRVIVSTSVASPDFSVSIYGSYQGQDKAETIMLTSAATPVPSANYYDDIFTLSKYNETHDLSVRRFDTSDELLYLSAQEKERKHQRLHFHSTPNNTAVAMILYKRHIRPLINDSDAPEITGIDNALLSCSISDMRESERQYAKANMKMEEGVALVKTMADLERHQSESVVRIIPLPIDNEDFHLIGWDGNRNDYLRG